MIRCGTSLCDFNLVSDFAVRSPEPDTDSDMTNRPHKCLEKEGELSDYEQVLLLGYVLCGIVHYFIAKNKLTIS